MNDTWSEFISGGMGGGPTILGPSNHRGRLTNTLTDWQAQNATREQRSNVKKREHCPCRVPGCLIKTSMGKPYCLEHLDNMPYYLGIKKNIDTIYVEISKMDVECPGRVIKAKPGQVDPDLLVPDSIVANDILLYLTYGDYPVSVEVLAKMLWLPLLATQNYVKYLKKKRLVKVTNIGSKQIVSLAKSKGATCQTKKPRATTPTVPPAVLDPTAKTTKQSA